MRATAGAVLLVGVLAVAGCGSSNDDPPGGSTSTSAAAQSIAADVPTGFDPCNIPQDVLTSATVGLRKGTTDDNTSRGPIKWRGCGYIVSDGYAASISLTNLTLAMVRDKHFPGERETTINGRTALITNQSQDTTNKTTCTLNAQMQGGSLEFKIDNSPGSSPKTRHLNACDIAQTLAEKVVPLIPAGA